MCDSISTGITQKIFKNRVDGHFLNLLCLPKNGHKSDSNTAHFEQNFNSTMSRRDIRKNMKFKVVKQLNLIGAMKTFTKPKCNLCMEEHLHRAGIVFHRFKG